MMMLFHEHEECSTNQSFNLSRRAREGVRERDWSISQSLELVACFGWWIYFFFPFTMEQETFLLTWDERDGRRKLSSKFTLLSLKAFQKHLEEYCTGISWIVDFFLIFKVIWFSKFTQNSIDTEGETRGDNWLQHMTFQFFMIADRRPIRQTDGPFQSISTRYLSLRGSLSH